MLKMPIVDVILFGWNDAAGLPKVLESLNQQTLQARRIIA